MTSENCGRRNTSLERMKETISLMLTKEGINHGFSFKPRSDDVFIVTYPKCGTTWMQQILHQLRSGGDMSFEEISDVIPFVESAYDIGINMEDEQKFQPRSYNTHASYQVCPKGAKYIVIYREPCAAFFSYFNFFQGWVFQNGEISLDEFVKEYLLADNTESISYFQHLLGWWEHRNDSNVLFLFYEDMKDDLQSVVRMVGEFIGNREEENIKKAVEMSSFEFMKVNKMKFSAIRMARLRNHLMGAPADAIPCRVVTGSATKGRQLMDETTKQFVQRKWFEEIGKKLGFQNYEELRSAFKREKMNNRQ